jgi:molybdopterin/thiamine biosynthesis adenylyltransferase
MMRQRLAVPPIQATGPDAVVRIDVQTFASMSEILRRRYPNDEWGTLARFGWRCTPTGLVLTMASALEPENGDMDAEVPNVRFLSPFLHRAIRDLDTHPLALGVVHSHPEGAHTTPSWIDDDMDTYFRTFLADFAPDRPYASLIFAFDESPDESKGASVSATGRVWYEGAWHNVSRFYVDGQDVALERYPTPRPARAALRRRVARLESAYGEAALQRLADATIAVIGASGTGSPAVEVLARAGVGHIITIDPDHFDDSNLERIHGSTTDDADTKPMKVAIALRHIASINTDARVTAMQARVPQKCVVDALVRADAILGCTDSHAARLALSEIAFRYSVPLLDCSVTLEGGEGRVTGQVSRFVVHRGDAPCAICQETVNQRLVAQELMHPDERRQRQDAARRAHEAGDDGSGYWLDVPQLYTVGSLTTVTGALAAGYAIGWLTRRYDAPFTRMECNWLSTAFGTNDVSYQRRPSCVCGKVRGWSDQARESTLVGIPNWWPEPALLD